MLKGVHHRIVEVADTGNPYFERALLFVKSEYTDRAQEDLAAFAREYTKRAPSYSDLRQARAAVWFRRCALVLLGACVGAMIGVYLAFAT